MTDAPHSGVRVGTALSTIMRSPITVWVAFILVHLALGLICLYSPSNPLGDVTRVYRFWMEHAQETGVWVGLDTVWVYPILALVPMVVSSAFGDAQYGSTWLSMVLLLDVVAFGFLTGWGRSRERVGVAWWWVAFLLLLGPIALARIDSVSIALAVIGVLVIASRPQVAAVLLTAATWVKVWPAAIVVAALIALRERSRILRMGFVVSGVIIAVALLLGSGGNVLSFITEQTGRGLQVEAPVSTFWLWQALAGEPNTYVYFDKAILTFQVQGPGSALASALMTPLLAIAVLVVMVLGIRAARAGASAGDLLPPLALALVTTLIAFNKVGSPQYLGWIAVPIILGLATSRAGHGGSFRVPATMALVLAALTQVVYPYFYLALLALNPLLLAALTVRNVLEFVLLGWAVIAIVRSPLAPKDDADEDWLPSVWPLRSRHDSVVAESVKE